MKVLVTGGTGFVGSHAIRRLLEDGHEIRALARTPSKVAPLMAKMGVDPTGIEIVEGDITDEDAVAAATAGCDAVVHAAAIVAVTPDMEPEMERVNLAGATNVLGAAVEHGCDPIIHVSSVSAIFPNETDPITADHPVRGKGSYGRTKAACDRLARGLQGDGHPVIIIYPSGIVGPDDWNESINLASYKVWLTQGIPTAKGFATSYVDVRDLAEIMAASMTPGGGPHRFLATGTHIDAADLAVLLEGLVGKVRRLPLPRAGFWVWGKVGDVAKRFGRDLVVTSEGYEYMFFSNAGDDRPTTETTGVHFRPLDETFRDTFRWMAEAGHLEAKHIGKLAAD
ncbi:MAG: oxidoreductase [Acidimicrobiales bacterium]|nr:MAG: oxidoreductase [Acidimicrobiales bacterium]